MSSRRNEDVSLRFSCSIACAQTPWDVEGRYNAEGDFEPFDAEETDCPECRQPGAPTDEDVRVVR